MTDQFSYSAEIVAQPYFQGGIDLLVCPIIVVDKNLAVTTANKEAERAFRHLGPLRNSEISHLFSRESILIISQIFEGRTNSTGETIHSHFTQESGRETYIQWQAQPLVDAEGSVTYVVTTGIDTTENEKKIENLVRNEEIYRSIFENSSDAMFEGRFSIEDIQGSRSLTTFNPAFVKMFGFSSQEEIRSLGIPLTEIIIQNQQDYHTLDVALRSQGFIEGFEGELRRKDGSTFWGIVNIHMITNSDRRVTGIQGVITDITAQKEMNDRILQAKESVEQQVEERTRELEEARNKLQTALTSAREESSKIKTILQSIGDGVFVLDNERRIVLANDITSKLSGFRNDELLGSRYDERLHFIFESNHEVNREFVEDVYSRGVASEMKNHTALVRKDGIMIPVADSAAPLIDADDTVIGCVVVFRDVTRQREVERMKDEFVSVASHQLRTPLTALRWSAERLKKNKEGTLTADQQRLAEDMHISVKRLIQLVNDLLDVSRIESGKLTVKPVPTDLVELVNEVLKDSSARIQEKNQEVFLSFVPQLPLACVDPQLAHQIYMNLIANASSYSPPHSKITVKVSLNENEKMLYTNITDEGVGIPPSEQPRLFEKFFRGSNVSQVDSEGAGLGLYLVKELVELSGGKLGVNSPLFQTESGPKGTDFWFSLPMNSEYL